MVRDVVIELTTPIQRTFNVEQKSIRKTVEECMTIIKDHHSRHGHLEKVLATMQATLVREVKNSESDKNALNYELTRMQHIDRLKVMHAKDSFFNPDVGTLLPSLDTAFATSMASGLSQTPQP